MKIAYLGDENSFTHAAAQGFVQGGTAEFIGQTCVTACFEALESGIADLCVVPVENSVEGAVGETADCLAHFCAYVTADIILPVTQSLVGFKGAVKSDIKTIYSHPQALAQCRNFLKQNFPDAKVRAEDSTSGALMRITDKTIAAVARQAAAGTEILQSGIEDYKNNETRFFVLKKAPSFEGTKASIMFETLNKPGALISVLNLIAGEGINMTKIESRPAKTRLGRYIFFIDFVSDGGRDEISELLAKLASKTEHLKFLGNYKTVRL